ncbi:MAG: hypothetical protein ACOC3D_09850 [Pseudomonadota bacterium]
MNARPDNDPNLNPSLHPRTEKTYPTNGSDPAPADSASVQREEGRSWPWIWAVATIGGLLIVVWLLFF